MRRYFHALGGLGVLLLASLALLAPDTAHAQRFPDALHPENLSPELFEELPTTLWTDGKESRARANAPLREGSFERIADSKQQAIVNIEVKLPENPNFPGMEPLGQGSGFIIHPKGYVLTNAHVVATAKKINVTTSDRQVYTAHVVGLDPETDIALLRIDTTDAARPDRTFPILTFVDSGAVKPGRWVVAIGNPYGLNHTVTAGIVSAVGRREMSAQLSLRYTDFIQFDAAINLGNSGGPLLDMEGHVIGMNTALQRGNDLGFAIPTNMIRKVLAQMADGDMTRSWSGMALTNLSVEAARHLPHGRQGARVAGFLKDSPAGESNIKKGDVILAYNGRAVEDSEQLRWWIAMSPSGTPQDLTVQRGKRRLELQITLRDEPERASASTAEAKQPRTAPEGPRAFGLVLDVPSAEDPNTDGAEAEAPPAAGARIAWVEPASAAARAGLKVDDVITHVNDAPTADADAVVAASKTVKTGDTIGVRATRGSKRIFIFFRKD